MRWSGWTSCRRRAPAARDELSSAARRPACGAAGLQRTAPDPRSRRTVGACRRRGSAGSRPDRRRPRAERPIKRHPCDPAGRFLVGTTSLDGRREQGHLLSVWPDGRIEVLLDRISESNGLCWSLDGSTLYYVDSGEPYVRAYAYDQDTGRLGPRTDLIAIPEQAGEPDGLSIDEEGAIWVALWRGSAVRRYGPDGRLLAHLRMLASRPTCPGFGGDRLDRLYVTTAWEGMTPDERAGEPWAGHILVTAPGISGSVHTDSRVASARTDTESVVECLQAPLVRRGWLLMARIIARGVFGCSGTGRQRPVVALLGDNRGRTGRFADAATVRGIHAALATPFRPDDSVNEEVLAELIDDLLENGVHGLVVNGSTGEGLLLDQRSGGEPPRSPARRPAGMCQ